MWVLWLIICEIMSGFSVVEEAVAVGKRENGDTWGNPHIHSQHRRSKRYNFKPISILLLYVHSKSYGLFFVVFGFFFFKFVIGKEVFSWAILMSEHLGSCCVVVLSNERFVICDCKQWDD